MDVGKYPDAQLPEPRLNPPPQKPKRNYNKLALILGGLLLAGFCLFSIIVSGLMTIMSTASENQEEWLSVSDTFMQAMVENDVDSAYGLFSDRAKGDVRRSDLSRMTKGTFFALFDGYEGLELESWEINYDLAVGKSAILVYRVDYQGGYEGILQAGLVQDGASWKILWFEVTVPPDKVDDYVGLEAGERAKQS